MRPRFSCANTLSERLLGPGWSYEHSLTARWDRFSGTSWFALRPWRLCSTLSVDHRVNGRRLWQFVRHWLLAGHITLVVMTLLVWLQSAVFQTRPVSLAGGGRLLVRVMLEDPWPLIGVALCPYLPHTPPYPLSSEVKGLIAGLAALALIPTLLMPAWMAILGDTFAAARVRRIHLLRGLAYSLPGAVVFLASGRARWCCSSSFAPSSATT